MKICVSTANLGNIDQDGLLHTLQRTPDTWSVDFFGYNDSNFPPRRGALHPRLQAKIPKMLAHELNPGYDYYIWLDGTIAMTQPDSITWLIEKCLDHDMALFQHPFRRSIKEEAEYCYAEMRSGNSYLIERYQGEPMWEQVAHYMADPGFDDHTLFACGVFAYSGSIVQDEPNVMKDWFHHNARYSVQDQLSLPFLIQKHRIRYRLIEEGIFSNKYFSFFGHQRSIR